MTVQVVAYRSRTILFAAGAALLIACNATLAQPNNPTVAPTNSAASPSPQTTPPTTPAPKGPVTIAITSPAFTEGTPIPAMFTCDGANRSPELDIPTSLPPTGVTLAITLEDPDAPGGTFTHWVAWNLPVKSVPEAADATVTGIGLGANGAKRNGYTGPCPPKGSTHSYVFTVYITDAPAGLQAGASIDDLRTWVQGHVVAQGVLRAKYSR